MIEWPAEIMAVVGSGLQFWVFFLLSFSLLSLARKFRNSDVWILVSAIFLYSVNRFLLKPLWPATVYGQFFKYHFNDFLGAIVLLAYTNILIGLFASSRKKLTKFLHIFLLGIICSIVWEGIAPILLPYSTSDWLDCLSYLSGSVTYWLLNRSISFSKEQVKYTYSLQYPHKQRTIQIVHPDTTACDTESKRQIQNRQ